MPLCNYCQKDLPLESYEFLPRFNFHRFTCKPCVADYRKMQQQGLDRYKKRQKHKEDTRRILDSTYHMTAQQDDIA